MKYINTEDTEMVSTIIDPEWMVQHFNNLGLLDQEMSDNYSSNVVNMCNIATAYLGQAIMHHFGTRVKVCEGVFDMMGNHTWLLLPDEFIIDATLAQFIPSAPKMAFIEPDAKEYHAIKTYWFEDWVAQLDD